MSAEGKGPQPWFARPTVVGTATVVGCIVALFAYFKPWAKEGASQANTAQATTGQGSINQSTGNQGNQIQADAIHGNVTQTNVAPAVGNSVTAIGSNATAVGGDMHINNREVRHQYDAAPERALAVKNYLQVAQDACGKQVSMITDMDKDTVVELNAVPGLSRSEMYPTELVAEHLGEDAYDGILSRVEAAQQASGGAMALLMSNSMLKMTGMQSKREPEHFAAFEKGRSEWLQATKELCVYINDVRRKHSI